jgi:hypothetical protein
VVGATASVGDIMSALSALSDDGEQTAQ